MDVPNAKYFSYFFVYNFTCFSESDTTRGLFNTKTQNNKGIDKFIAGLLSLMGPMIKQFSCPSCSKQASKLVQNNLIIFGGLLTKKLCSSILKLSMVQAYNLLTLAYSWVTSGIV
jgi:hypothetical protein